MEVSRNQVHKSLLRLLDGFDAQRKQTGKAVKPTCDCGCGEFHRRGFELKILVRDYDGVGKNRLFSTYFVNIEHSTAALAFWMGNAKRITTKGGNKKTRKNGRRVVNN